ncbi:hypothetical protein CSV75_04360 [Sporosarcina sp. P18a]|uniref:hypothetical protein n=1 Tax=Sporosarcina sp. P18a TaxID=2048259 RepID=UPI000C16900E|nr:hypothetical protein [Sporosarcina sp. P18a]PIC81018.1 hypothetical protein CSV75_04360 [Sporosarcina sp. P18a]
MLEDIEVWDGLRYRKVIGKVMTPNGLKDFYRPINFTDNMATQYGMSMLSSTGIIKDGKLTFDTLIRFDIS